MALLKRLRCRALSRCITIDRPKALNALNPEVLADLKAARGGCQ